MLLKEISELLASKVTDARKKNVETTRNAWDVNVDKKLDPSLKRDFRKSLDKLKNNEVLRRKQEFNRTWRAENEKEVARKAEMKKVELRFIAAADEIKSALDEANFDLKVISKVYELRRLQIAVEANEEQLCVAWYPEDVVDVRHLRAAIEPIMREAAKDLGLTLRYAEATGHTQYSSMYILNR